MDGRTMNMKSVSTPVYRVAFYQVPLLPNTSATRGLRSGLAAVLDSVLKTAR
jgi:hypothetical protein